LSLESNQPEFSHFVCSVNGADAVRSVDGKVPIRFHDKGTPEVQTANATIRAVDRSGKESKEYDLTVRFYPKELYAAGGHASRGCIVIQQSDLALSASHVEDWILDRPTREDVEYAQRTWKHLIRPERTAYENARDVARSLIDDVERHRGLPTRAFDRAPPFEQYRLATSGKGQLMCTHISGIFAHACNCLGIPCRIIHMQRLAPLHADDQDGPTLILAEGHGTTEIFSEQEGGWVWLDLTFRVLGAYVKDIGPINMARLHTALNDSCRFPHLTLDVYDPRVHKAKRSSVLDDEQFTEGLLLNYFKRDQQFRYTRWEGPSDRPADATLSGAIVAGRPTVAR
jgi:hypothetical protein